MFLKRKERFERIEYEMRAARGEDSPWPETRRVSDRELLNMMDLMKLAEA